MAKQRLTQATYLVSISDDSEVTAAIRFTFVPQSIRQIVDKKMEDAEIGNYKAPGLLLQKETVRLLLEPVARVAPGTEGDVDLYLMPAYDYIRSLY